VAKRQQAHLSNKALGRINQSERLEGCFIFTRDEWYILASALDRFACGRAIPVKVKARHLAKRLFAQIKKYILEIWEGDEHG